MKCIDAVEGTVKCILTQLHTAHKQAASDDSEYIHQVKAVINAAERYIVQNPELIQDPTILKNVLYTYSRNLWLREQQSGEVPQESGCNGSSSESDDFQTYYYDYIYDRDMYPN